jgi:hypothetical protein
MRQRQRISHHEYLKRCDAMRVAILRSSFEHRTLSLLSSPQQILCQSWHWRR